MASQGTAFENSEKELVNLEEGLAVQGSEQSLDFCPMCGVLSDWRNDRVASFRHFYWIAGYISMGLLFGITLGLNQR
jgi:hypothetical protein